CENDESMAAARSPGLQLPNERDQRRARCRAALSFRRSARSARSRGALVFRAAVTTAVADDAGGGPEHDPDVMVRVRRADRGRDQSRTADGESRRPWRPDPAVFLAHPPSTVLP